MTRRTAERPDRRRAVIGSVAACTVGAFLPTLAPAESSAPPDTGQLLRRVAASTAQRSFAGVYVVSAGGSMSSARLVHYCNGREQIDKIESLDGQMRRIYRHNDLVHVLWPQSHEASIEPRDLIGRWPGSSVALAHRPGFAGPAASAAEAPAEGYDVVSGREDRVAGYEAQVYTFRPRDTWRYAQRWWIERDSGLLLRSDLVGPKGEVLESAGFSELQIGVKLHPQQLLHEMHRLQGYRVTQPQFLRTSLEQEGWSLRRPVPAFRPHLCVRRSPPRQPGQDNGPAAATMLQTIYTDGLMHVSLFIEPYDATRHSTDNPAVFGATRVHGRREGDWWITAVGEVPAATLQAFSLGLERVKS